jgi:heme exporter protein D
MDALSTFLDMGGYAGFIWPAYAMAAAVLIGLFVASSRSLKVTEAALKALERQEGGAEEGQ